MTDEPTDEELTSPSGFSDWVQRTGMTADLVAYAAAVMQQRHKAKVRASLRVVSRNPKEQSE